VFYYIFVFEHFDIELLTKVIKF